MPKFLRLPMGLLALTIAAPVMARQPATTTTQHHLSVFDNGRPSCDAEALDIGCAEHRGCQKRRSSTSTAQRLPS
jgi:hypothetical protein